MQYKIFLWRSDRSLLLNYADDDPRSYCYRVDGTTRWNWCIGCSLFSQTLELDDRPRFLSQVKFRQAFPWFSLLSQLSLVSIGKRDISYKYAILNNLDGFLKI